MGGVLVTLNSIQNLSNKNEFSNKQNAMVSIIYIE